MDIKVYHSTSEVAPGAWEALDPHLPRSTRAWFETSEAYFKTMNHYYLTAWDDGQLRALLPLFDSWAPQYYKVVQSYPGITQRLLRSQRHLTIGSRLGFESEVIGDQQYGEALLSEATEFAASKGVDFLASNVARAPLPGWDQYRVATIFSVNVLHPVGDSYDDFMLAHFRSKRRSGFKKEMLRSEPIFEVPMLGNEARFNALRTVSCERQGGPNYLEDSFYTHLAHAFGDNLLLTATGTEEEWTGANSMISTKHGYCGMGVGVRDRNDAYFNLMVHDPMQRAYATGRKAIDLGPSCDQAKRLRGADPIPMTSYLCPVSKRCKLTLGGIRPITKFSSRLLPRIRRKLGF